MKEENTAIKLEEGEVIESKYRFLDLFPPKNWFACRAYLIKWGILWVVEYKVVTKKLI